MKMNMKILQTLTADVMCIVEIATHQNKYTNLLMMYISLHVLPMRVTVNVIYCSCFTQCQDAAQEEPGRFS